MNVYVLPNNVIVHAKEYLTEEEITHAWETTIPEQIPEKEGYTTNLVVDYDKKYIDFEYSLIELTPEQMLERRVKELEDIVVMLTV